MASVLRKKRFVSLVLLPVLILFVALAPFLLSSSTALNLFVQTVNARIPGRLSIESWLIGWQQGVLCQNVVYTDKEKGISLSLPSITSNRGLLELLLAPKNLGTVNVDSPRIELSGTAVQAFFAGGRLPSEDRKSPPSQAEAPPLWDQVLVRLKSRGGSLKAEFAEQDVTLAFRDIGVESSLAAGIAQFELTFQSEDQGFAEAFGSLNLPAREQGWLETIIADMEVKLSGLRFGNILRAGSAIPWLPQGEGEVNADLKVKAVGVEGLEVRGLAELSGVKLSGGFLGEDQPAVKKIRLTVEDGNWTSLGWSVKGLEVDSDTLTMKAAGKFSADAGEFSVQGTLNLPVLFDQVPQLLKVHESTFLETGIFEFNAEYGDAGSETLVNAKAKLSDVGGIFKGKRFFWDSPVSFHLNSEKKGADLQVNGFRFDAPFGRVKGSGGLDSFSLDGELDIERALGDMSTLFQLDLSGSGEMELSVRSERDDADESGIKVDADLKVDDFTLRRGEQPVVPANELSLSANFKVPDTCLAKREGELDLQLVASSWLGETFLVMNGEKTGEQPFKGFYTADLELDLGQLSSLLHSFGILNPETRMAGTMQMQSAGFAGERSLELRDLTAEISSLILEGNGSLFHEPGIRLKISQPLNEEVAFLSVRELKLAQDRERFFGSGAGLNRIDFAARSVALHDVEVESASLKGSLAGLGIPDWRTPLTAVRTQFNLEGDLGNMSEAGQALGLLPRDTAFSGSAKASFALAEKEGADQEMKADLRIDGLTIRRRDGKPVDAGKVVLSALVEGQIPNGAMTVRELKLDSGLLKLDLPGTVSGDGETRLLELSGVMVPVLNRLAPLLGAEFDVDLQMKGGREEQVALRYPLWRPLSQSLDQLSISAAFHAGSMELNGIAVRDAVLPLKFAESRLHVELSGQMDGGTVELIADTDFAADPAVVRMPGNSRILAGVKLNKPLVDNLFARIHPLFGALARPSGSIGVRLDSFWWPLVEEGKNEANFAVTFDIADIRLEKNAFLKSVLQPFGLDKEALHLQNSEMSCMGRNGRIKCLPVSLLAGGAAIIVEGELYLDGALEYSVEAPVAKAEKSVRVDVQGTVWDPAFDADKVKGDIQGLTN